MSGWLEFLHSDLMLTRESISIQEFISPSFRCCTGVRSQHVFYFWTDKSDTNCWHWKTPCLVQRKHTHIHSHTDLVALICCPNFDLCIAFSQGLWKACHGGCSSNQIYFVGLIKYRIGVWGLMRYRGSLERVKSSGFHLGGKHSGGRLWYLL